MAGKTLLLVAEPHSEDERLELLGLSATMIHDAFRPALSTANGRSRLALRSTPGTDLYHNGMEQFALRLSQDGWQLVYVDHQPRLLHPEGLISFTLAAATNVGERHPRKKPRTGRKGKATRASLDAAESWPALFEIGDTGGNHELVAAAEAAPFWMLVHEKTDQGLKLELLRPQSMSPAGIVNDWSDRISIPFLPFDDMSVFDSPDDETLGVDVPVEPR
ncbi:hypothetical protein [Arthrobacter sp. KK5.5]|uniref:hypothetical protein n=1 Tax=Arthrobacter sp. KK5.5 TaxID=3373084 RepID=UPI003EE43526